MGNGFFSESVSGGTTTRHLVPFLGVQDFSEVACDVLRHSTPVTIFSVFACDVLRHSTQVTNFSVLACDVPRYSQGFSAFAATFYGTFFGRRTHSSTRLPRISLSDVRIRHISNTSSPRHCHLTIKLALTFL